MHDVIDPVVGRKYFVNTATYFLHNWGKTVSVPVIGEIHADKEFSALAGQRHIHIDARFTTRFHARVFQIGSNGKTNHVIWIDRVPDLVFEMKKMVCKRLLTCIDPPEKNQEYKDWYRKFIGHSCKGRVCPHRGMIMHRYQNGFRCPLHGLKAGEGEFIVPNWELENK